MIGRIIEIAENNRYLSVYRGFLLVNTTIVGVQHEIGRIALDDIEAVITHAYGLSYSNNLLVALAERGIPLVVCGNNHHPISMLLPFDGHHLQASRFEAQILASKPKKKQLWATIVAAKLKQQAIVLESLGMSAMLLKRLSSNVKSGDPTNMEAQGARYYWRKLFGEQFRRQQNTTDNLNILLNYGYTILRSSTARATLAAGLHPTLALFHSNESNAMRLVDDLIEPFRAVVDVTVWKLSKEGTCELTPMVKKRLAMCLYQDIQSEIGISPVGQCIQRLATSLAQVYIGERNTLQLPISIIIDREKFDVSDPENE